jgi:serine/threonine protein kinase
MRRQRVASPATVVYIRDPVTSPTQTTTERVGRYQLLEPIGIGPSGTVSRAKVFGVAGFERQFAVKRFHTELTATAQLAQALSAAARSYGGLEHPRIARMSEFGVAQGTTFTAVEFVVGLDALRLIGEVRLAGTTLAAGGALALVSQAARAVGYAHGRGLTHLGLSPTNVIVTADGDVKITDFGILSATLPQRPVDVVRLASRIQYLAPEQLANEATSAATDVFALGVLAFELVTGQRTFRGESPQQIAQSVMAGPPAEPPLPRPIVRVLQRCLARSPFERFPDARALADALDAALRVAPVPGTRKDIGSQVSQTLERLAALHSSEHSGVVALNISQIQRTGNAPVIPSLGNRNTPPPAMPPLAPVSTRDALQGLDVPTTEFKRNSQPALVGPGSVSLADLAEHARTASTLPDLPKPMTTMAGLAPPPIPVPQGVSPPPIPPVPAVPNAPPTLLGIQNAKPIPGIPGITPKPPSTVTPTGMPKFRLGETVPGTSPIPPIAPVAPVRPTPPSLAKTPPPLPRPPEGPPKGGRGPEVRPQSEPTASQARTDLVPPDLGEFDHEGLDATMRGVGIEPHEAYRQEKQTNEMPKVLAERLADQSTKPTAEYEAVSPGEAWRDDPVLPELPIGPASSAAFLPPAPPAPPRTSPPPWDAAASGPRHERDVPTMAIRERDAAPKTSNRWLVIGAVGLGVIAFGVWFTHDLFDDPPVIPDKKTAVLPAKQPDASVAATTPDAAQVTAMLDGGSAAPIAIDAGQVATTPVDAAVAAAPIDAAPVAPTPSDSLVVTSTPPGARVFLDGADMGTTPLKQPGTADRHTLAIMLPGHELYVAQVDGKGSFAIPLKEVTPTGGPAGIKVLKCKDKDRYYVFVDGKPTGQTCPTERIETDLGPHVVEVYDVTNDSRRKFEIDVKDTRLSHRIRID